MSSRVGYIDIIFAEVILKIMKAKKILDKLLTPEQVAKKLNVSIFTVYRWIKAGKLKAIKLTPRVFRIEESELKRFIKKHKTK